MLSGDTDHFFWIVSHQLWIITCKLNSYYCMWERWQVLYTIFCFACLCFNECKPWSNCIHGPMFQNPTIDFISGNMFLQCISLYIGYCTWHHLKEKLEDIFLWQITTVLSFVLLESGKGCFRAKGYLLKGGQGYLWGRSMVFY